MLNPKTQSKPDARHKSASVSNRRRTTADDARILRTRQRLDTAFLDLLHRKPYGDIRVSDITRKARIGRATFYAHYPSKDDLLLSQFRRIVAPMVAAGRMGPLVDAQAFFAHIQSAPRLYQTLIASPQAGNAPVIMRRCFESRLSEILAPAQAAVPHSQVPVEVQARFVAASLFVVVECWLHAGARQSPEAMQNLFTQLTERGLSGK